MTPPRRIDKYLRDCTHQPLAVLRAACSEGRVTIIVPPSQASSTSCSRIVTHLDELVFDGDLVEFDGNPVVAPLAVDERTGDGARAIELDGNPVIALLAVDERTNDQARAIELDGNPVIAPLAVDERTDVRAIVEGSRHYFALNKPCGVTSSTSDPDGFEDLSAWLRDLPEGVFPVGRLDRMTSGLLLFTNDGDFSNALLHPEHHVTKHYRLLVNERIAPTDPRIALFVHGVEHPGHAAPLRALSASVVSYNGQQTELWLSLNEGKHRQIRKMCHALRIPLAALHRRGIGSIELGALEPGGTRALTRTEVDALWSEAGGRESILRRQIDALQRRAAAVRTRGAPELRLERWLRDALSSVPASDPRSDRLGVPARSTGGRGQA